MIVKTLTEFKRAVEYGAGIRGQIGAGATFRHPVDDVETEINSSYGEYRELLVERDFDFFLTESAQASLPTSRADTNENYSLIDWPIAAQVIKRVDVYIQSTWYSLVEVDWSRLRDSIPSSGTTVAKRPLFFSPKAFGTISAATEVAGKIAIAPFCNTGKVKLTYMPHWTEITDDSSEFIFPTETGYRWAVWNCIAKVLIRDGDPMGQLPKVEGHLLKAEERIGRFSARTIATGGSQMRRSRRYFG